MRRTNSIAVLIPAYNEASTIQGVVKSFAKALPDAHIYVYDNASTDDTVERATAAGAIVRAELCQGKGNVVRRMFADVEADRYVLVDADATYETAVAARMLELLRRDNLDMVVAVRESTSHDAYRSGHRFGNELLSWMVGVLFGKRFSDVLSGYRVFSRRFVKSFPALSRGFEIETELTVHALEMRLPTAEHPTDYKARPSGSESKLHTYRDGFSILRAIFSLLRTTHPLKFFGTTAVTLALVSVVIFIPVLQTYLATGEVPRLPTVMLSAALMLTAALSAAAGIILHYVTRLRLEMKRLHYLSLISDEALSNE